MKNIRISAISFKIRPHSSFADFAEHVTSLVNQAMDSRPDFILFPEDMTFELTAPEVIVDSYSLTQHTDAYIELFFNLAKNNRVYIVAGTHLRQVNNQRFNTSHLFTPAGMVMEQRKVHLVPLERAYHISAGDSFTIFETEKVKFSILTCYDLEFPEAARLVTIKGAEIVLSPSATAAPHGYWRVRHCAQARCIENQIYVAHASLISDLGIPGYRFTGMASILCPCDAGFPDKGIVAEGKWDVEHIVTADVDLELLQEVRKNGTTTNLDDRRFDILEAVYKEEIKRNPSVLPVS